MKAKHIKHTKTNDRNDINLNKISSDKVVIFILLLLCISYNAHSVSAFDYPEKPESYYILDNADVLSIETEHLVSDINSTYYKEKRLESSLVTISEPVGDKKEYTKQLKKWWEIGNRNNGFIIAIYPESKDCIEIIIDDGLKTYISNADISRYKGRIIDGIKNGNLDDEVKVIVEDLEILLRDYSKKDTFIENAKLVFDNLMFNIKPKEKTNPFGSILKKVIVGLNIN